MKAQVIQFRPRRPAAVCPVYYANAGMHFAGCQNRRPALPSAAKVTSLPAGPDPGSSPARPGPRRG